ncbi:hypothetical protein [Streptomyces nodosus]|uniref:hypothetical protein n=1 Tax=Streptomyces nodosus TaxID=40318 RepID=UPI0037F43D03
MRESEEPSPEHGPIFERMVDRALGLPRVAATIRTAGARRSHERLRARALEARDTLLGVATDEYERYAALRAAVLAPSGRPARGDGRTDRLLLVLAVLVPSLGVVAAGVFLLCGFGLRAFAARPHVGDGLVMSGVIVAAVTAGAALGDLAWLLAARARGRDGGDGDDPADRDPGVRRAREDWERAVMERGLVPFLLERADLERAELRHLDAERVDLGRVDVGGVDAGRVDAGRVDAGCMDLGRGQDPVADRAP